MKKILFFSAVVLLCTGCFQYKRTTVINPDGSGKMLIQAELQKGALISFSQSNDDEQAMIKSVSDFINKSKGVEAWGDISYKINEQDGVDFKGTAYFRDISSVKLYNMGASEITFKKLENNDMLVELFRSEKKDAAMTGKTSKIKIDSDKIEIEIAKQRAQYKKLKPLFAAFFKMMETEETILIKGDVKQVENLKKLPSGDFVYSFEGEEMLKKIDAVISDDKIMKEILLNKGAIMSGFESSNILQNLKEKLGKSTIVYKPASGFVFDYEREKAQAKNERSENKVKLFQEKPEEVKKPDIDIEVPSKDACFKSMQLTELSLKKYKIYDKGSSCEVKFMGTFEGSVAGIKQVQLLKAVSDNGTDLLPKYSSIHPFLNNKKDAVSFSMMLLPLPKGAQGFSEISGRCMVAVSAGIKTIDAGLKELKTGAESLSTGVKIITIKTDERFSNMKRMEEKKREVLELQIKSNSEAIKKVKLMDENNTELKLERYGSTSNQDECRMSFAVDGKIPEKGKIVIEMYDKIKEYIVPFHLDNIKITDFTGGEGNF